MVDVVARAKAVCEGILPTFCEMTDTTADAYAVLSLVSTGPAYEADNCVSDECATLQVDIWQREQRPTDYAARIRRALRNAGYQWMDDREDYAYSGVVWQIIQSNYWIFVEVES